MKKLTGIVVVGYLGAGPALNDALQKLQPKPANPAATNSVRVLAKGEIAHGTRE